MIKHLSNGIKEDLKRMQLKRERYEIALNNEFEKQKLYNAEKQKIRELCWISTQTYDMLIKELSDWLMM